MAQGLKVLAMFPGQGSQYVGMGRALLSEFPTLHPLFEEAEDAAKLSIRKLCVDGPDDELKLTANTQPCILSVSVAIWQVLVHELGFAPSLFAGHSLGEYAAVVAAGKLPFSQAVALVRRRGEAMQEAVPAGLGAMAAVLNTNGDELAARCLAVSKTGSVVEVGNYNSPQQQVVAGHKTAVERLCQGLEADKIRFVLLPVSAPFHSSLMAPAREVMGPLLESAAFARNDRCLIPNLTAEVVADYGPRYLIEQINSPVRWTQTLATASQYGCSAYVEVGPGKVLAGLAKRSLAKDIRIITTDELKQGLKDIQALEI